jgi:hypothetical protein
MDSCSVRLRSGQAGRLGQDVQNSEASQVEAVVRSNLSDVEYQHSGEFVQKQ